MMVSILLAPSNVGAEAGAAVREKLGVNKRQNKNAYLRCSERWRAKLLSTVTWNNMSAKHVV